MSNFIDKTFTLIADILLKILPTSRKNKRAFAYYRSGMAAQTKGRYSEALENYYESLSLDEDPYDRSFTLYNIGLIYGNMGNYTKSLEFYYQALSLNSNMPQTLYNIGVICHMQATRAEESGMEELLPYAEKLFDKAGEYWIKALKLAPDKYPGARNWLKVSGRLDGSDI